MMKIKHLHFEIGGFFSDSRTLKFEGGFFHFDISQPFENHKQCILYEVNDKEIEQLSLKIEQLKVLDWEKEYTDIDVLDGTQWELKITYNGNLKKHIYGSNAYPNQDNIDSMEYSSDFKKLLKTLNTFMRKPNFFG